ncbi:MAG: SAM-dependent methyltransferase [Nitrospirae bacterium]|nr:SAM-dependent methyltransferase [Nitrospirota bacterium]
MSLLKQKIIDKIRAEGPISFETFMSMALYDPESGYYTRESTEIGRAGDFYTSPHLHRIFGIMIGRQIEEMWGIIGKPDRFSIVEMGAGMGYLAKDMLDYISTKELFGHIDYTIIELNPVIRDRQKSLLKDYAGKMSWVSGPGDIGTITGCFLSNELLDALPVHLVTMGDMLTEIFVSIGDKQGDDQDNQFIEVQVPCDNNIKSYLKEFSIDLPAGYKTEINLKIRNWLEDISGKLEKGFVLTIDYGYSSAEYYSEERSTGTLLCYHKHQLNEDPYQHIGEQDITAHVNFSAVKKWGEALGLRTDGYCPQGTYLVALGIDEAITQLFGDSPDPFPTPKSVPLFGDPFQMAQIKGLIFPQGMGASHQVMVQSKGIDAARLRGFTLRNHAERL